MLRLDEVSDIILIYIITLFSDHWCKISCLNRCAISD